MQLYHNSHDLKYRTPFGAVTTSSEVTLSLECFSVRSCYVIICRKDHPDEKLQMVRSGGIFEITFRVPDDSCILWYYFEALDSNGATCFYGNNQKRLGGIGHIYDKCPVPFQITVYEYRAVPEWYKNAVVYQIFPDRFCRGSDWRSRREDFLKAHLSGKKGGPDICVQEDWNATPCYLKNECGEITSWQFYGGTIKGILEKLDYISSLGVTCIYLNPIFRSASNHKYDTADYMTIDEGFGDLESFKLLASEAEKRNISIILDGVFNHTGADSIYFNKYGNFSSCGACQSTSSPYYDWYTFKNYPYDYECWWGVKDLPNVNEMTPSYLDFICNDRDSVIRYWLRCGARGWRLDVADELPDKFIEKIRSAMTEEKQDSLLLGEVWEDASNKESYGELRRYFLGKELDSTMNYPFRTASVDFIKGKISSQDLCDRLMSLYENYPHENFYSALNLIGSHDRARIMTLLGDAPEGLSDVEKRTYRLSDDKRYLAKRRLLILSILQFTSPGVPCIYYGDEVGMEGFEDPYNRAAFPWGSEDMELKAHFMQLSWLRKAYPCLVSGSFEPFAVGQHIYGCRRKSDDCEVLILINRGLFEHEPINIPLPNRSYRDLMNGRWYDVTNETLSLTMEPMTAIVIAI